MTPLVSLFFFGGVSMFTEKEIEYYKNLSVYERSKELVERLFKDRVDKSRKSYMNHLIKVSEDFEDEKIRSMALMHDVLEDSNLQEKDLQNLGYDDEFIEVLKILTNTHDTYDEYIDAILQSGNLIALQIKLKDLLHNMDISRFENPQEEDIERIKNKYLIAYVKILKKIEGEIKHD